MTQDQEHDRTEPAGGALDAGEVSQRLVSLTGMSQDAAETFAAFHSGRFAPRTAFRDAA